MPKTKRTVLAFWLAPLAAPAVFCLSDIVPYGRIPTMSEFASAFALISVYALPVSYLATLFVGLPTIVFLEKSGRLTLTWLIACAAIEGAILLVLLTETRLPSSISMVLRTASLGSVMAVGVAVVFWYLSGITRRLTGRAHTARAG